MGAIGESVVAYAQPLIDQTDGSQEQMSRALALSQLCWNLALLPQASREEAISKTRPSLKMDDDEFNDFLHSLVEPMIRRHEEMFPRLHRSASAVSSPRGDWLRAGARMEAPAEMYPGTDRYAPCPCNSGRKYKFCCGAKSR